MHDITTLKMLELAKKVFELLRYHQDTKELRTAGQLVDCCASLHECKFIIEKDEGQPSTSNT